MKANNLVFLKLGGSLITNKNKPRTPQLGLINRVAAEIAETLAEAPEIQLLIGHGSGSFGHAVASQYQTQSGGATRAYWRGFAEVWKAARELDQILIANLASAGLPVLAFPPSAGVISRDGAFLSWDIEPIRQALDHNLIPVVQGDVVFDQVLGGTIFSTEQIFSYLSKTLQPQRILLAGLDPGVYRHPDQKQEIIPLITPDTAHQFLPALSGSQSADVTGGMESKINEMLSLLKIQPDLQVQVFSGAETGQIKKALLGNQLGTTIASRPNR